MMMKTMQTWQDNIRTWTGLSLVEAVRAAENHSQWRKIVHDAAEPCIIGRVKEQKRTGEV